MRNNTTSIMQMDVKKVYIVPASGFQSGLNTSEICELKKSLYKLKQAPRAWNVKITQRMRRMGFVSDGTTQELVGGSNRSDEDLLRQPHLYPACEEPYLPGLN